MHAYFEEHKMDACCWLIDKLDDGAVINQQEIFKNLKISNEVHDGEWGRQNDDNNEICIYFGQIHQLFLDIVQKVHRNENVEEFEFLLQDGCDIEPSHLFCFIISVFVHEVVHVWQNKRNKCIGSIAKKDRELEAENYQMQFLQEQYKTIGQGWSQFLLKHSLYR
jgi:hypothetical protein